MHSGLLPEKQIQVGTFYQLGGLYLKLRHDVVGFLHPRLKRLVLLQHHLQFEEVAKLLHLIEVDPGSADQQQGALLLHPADLAPGQAEGLPQAIWFMCRGQLIEALLGALLIGAAVEDELAGRGGKGSQLQTTGVTAKEGVILLDLDGALIGDGECLGE